MITNKFKTIFSARYHKNFVKEFDGLLNTLPLDPTTNIFLFNVGYSESFLVEIYALIIDLAFTILNLSRCSNHTVG